MKKILLVSIVMLSMTRSSLGSTYHLIGEDDLRSRTRDGYIFEPSLETEGFTHAAKLDQVVAAANRHYKNVNRTLLLKIDESKLIYPLVYDYVERHKQYFPHIYGPLNLSAIEQIFLMPRNADGNFRLPEIP
ncbi:MAG: hypothetical protein A4S09_10945 [Proteobacteria bacterium SG_bin7]|nr:MAG: hypothetical protein A4S09_10945 [Proteobacteria bacterium SG_bin7]